MGKYKRKADCTPEEWEEYSRRQREYERRYREKTREVRNAKNRIENLTEEQKEKRREYQRKYREKHRDAGRKASREWYNKNKEKYLEKRKEDRLKNHDRVIARERKLYDKYREKKRIYSREYRKTHKKRRPARTEEQRKREREYKKYIRAKNPEKYKKILEKSHNSRVKYIDYYNRLSIDEKPISDENGYMLCLDYFTKKYFYPTRKQVYNRVRALEGRCSGENHLYSSDESKELCQIYNQVKYPKYNKPYKMSRNADSRLKTWRDMVISRADGHCERCGKECDSLIAHHKVPVASCAMMAADIDNGMALCPECHKEVHSTDGCRLHELAAEKREAV